MCSVLKPCQIANAFVMRNNRSVKVAISSTVIGAFGVFSKASLQLPHVSSDPGM